MENWDLIVIGAGPAGLSAAIWSSDLRLRTLVLEASGEPGGQLLSVHNPIKNYPGKDAANGREFRDAMLDQVERSDAVLSLSSRVVATDLANLSVTVDDGRKLTADAIIIATGVRRRELTVPGEREFAGRGILGSGVRDRAEAAGRHVVIVGGGDAALENALLLSETAAKVTVIHRGARFKARDEFVSQVDGRNNVDILLNTTVSRIIGGDTLTAVEITSASSPPTTVEIISSTATPATGEIISGPDTTTTGEIIFGSDRRLIEADRLLIRIGVEPNTELFQTQIATDPAGYVVVDPNCRTTLPNVFAIGDAASPLSPTIPTAAGMAATAVKGISKRRTPL